MLIVLNTSALVIPYRKHWTQNEKVCLQGNVVTLLVHNSPNLIEMRKYFFQNILHKISENLLFLDFGFSTCKRVRNAIDCVRRYPSRPLNLLRGYFKVISRSNDI